MTDVDLALVDGDVAKILGDFFMDGGIDDDDRAMLPHALENLERAVPFLEPPGREYFAIALELLREVDRSSLDEARRLTSPNTE